MNQIVGGKRYSTATAELICDDAYWDGHNFERRGRNDYLYKTPKGNFFLVHLTQWQGERDSIEPISLADARMAWEHLPEKHIDYEEAFGEPPEEA